MAQTKEERREYERRWRAANPEKVRLKSRRNELKRMRPRPLHPIGRPCSRCKEPFTRPQKHAYCGKCSTAYSRERNKLPHAKLAAISSHRVRAYGITPQAYADMVRVQGGACAICGNTETALRRGVVRTLCVDHCHTTGKVRGLLCRACNAAIGGFKDNPEILRKAADYLESHRA